MKKLLVLVAFGLFVFSPVLGAEAATKKMVSSRSDYTKAQQKKLFEEGLKVCRKKHGGQLHHVQVDYRKRRYVCWIY